MLASAIRTALPSVLVTLAYVAVAQAPNISWSAPVDCGTTEEVRVAVVKLLRQDATIPPSMSFAGSIAPTPDQHWQLTLKGVSNSGTWTRRLVGASCGELRNAAEVLIALAIDPNAKEPEANSTLAVPIQTSSTATDTRESIAGTPVPSREATPAAVVPIQGKLTPALSPPVTPRDSTRPPVTTPRRTALAERPESRFLAMARAGLASGLLPESTLLVAIGAASTWDRFRATGEFGWLLPQNRYATRSPERGASIAAWAASVHGGYVQRFRLLELSPSAGLLGGYLSGRGIGTAPDSMTQGAAWVAAATRLTAALSIARDWSVVATTDAWYILGAPRFKLRASDERLIFEPTRVGGVVALGVALRLW